MRRSALVLSVLAWASLWVGSAAGAVSLSLTTDKSVYTTGESIEITLVADTAGAAPDIGVFLVVGFSDPTLVDGVGAVATQSTAITSLGGQLTWDKQNPACRFDRCTILNQLAGLTPVEPDPMIVIGTLTLPTIAPGVLTLDPGVENIIYFGASTPPPITVTIVGDPIVDPDPDPVDPGPDPIDPEPDPIDPGPGPIDPGSAAPEPSAAVVFGIGPLGLALRMRGRG